MRCSEAVGGAGGLDDVEALAVGGQQHGMVCLDDEGGVVRDALLWNDTRSAAAADDLVAELDGGAGAWAEAVGSVPLASFTVTKLRWLADARAGQRRPHRRRVPAARLADLAAGRRRAASTTLTTDRGDASGTGYWSPADGDVPPRPAANWPSARLRCCRRSSARPPRPGTHAAGRAARPRHRRQRGGGAGRRGRPRRRRRLARHVRAWSSRGQRDARPPTRPAAVAGFADATGHFLPLVCTLNAARVLDSTARMLGVVARRARPRSRCRRRPGADGLVMVPYFDGERTPNRPDATAAVHGLRHDNADPGAPRAGRGRGAAVRAGRRPRRAARRRASQVERALLVGGGARSAAVRAIAPGDPRRAGRRARARASTSPTAPRGRRPGCCRAADEPPQWQQGAAERFEADPQPEPSARATARCASSRRHAG